MQIGLGAMALSMLFLLSCNEAEQHEMLTFFFDGVPPLGGELAGTGYADASDPNAAPDPNAPPEFVWYQHEPSLGCEACHGDRKKRGFSRQVNLVAPVPDLCYQCHEELRDLPGDVHGPVAVGVCTFCHEPHRTRNEHLLKKPVPELCYQCHDPAVIEYFDSHHAEESYANCNRCHEGHASEEPGLLKKDWQETVSSTH
jgi:predicted CXXCH cytochrome family protein